MRILLVEDERKVANFVNRGLTELGHQVNSTRSVEGAESHAARTEFDLIILDVMLPDGDGFSLARRLRAGGYHGPILMLTALSGTKDKVKGLDAGADDYLTKPFEFEELAARVRALLRRATAIQSDVLSCGDLELNLISRAVTRAGNAIELSMKEFALLEFLLRNAGRPVSRTTIGQKVWGVHFEMGSNVIDVYFNLLRKKIDHPFPSKLIHTVTGLGYVLKES